MQTIPGGHPKGVDVMRNILTKYTTRAGLCAMALVLAAALVLAGCKQEAEPSRQETQLEKDIKALAGKGAGIHEVKADKTLTNADMEHIKEALQSLPDTVKVNLNLSSATEITSIGLLAFSNCTALASVSIPESVKSIEGYAFSGCTSLTSFTIPESVTSIGTGVFSDCTSLKSVTISNNIKSIPTLTFSGCTALASVSIPESVTSIRDQAFSSCTALTSVSIPESVTSIEHDAFSGCTALASVSIPESVTIISERTFWNCSNLTEVSLPNTMNTIESRAFEDCTKLTTVSTYGTKTDPGGKGISSYAFYGCSALKSVTIPESVTSIRSSAFYNCSALDSVTFKDTTGWKIYNDTQPITVTTPSENATKLKKGGDWYSTNLTKS